METLEVKLPEAKNLEDLFNILIAEEQHVNKEDVTVEFIMRQREKSIYPDTRFKSESGYGGYVNLGLASFTGNELKEIEVLVDGIMKRI